MVDILALAVSHGLLLIAAWRLLWRPELDSEGGTVRAKPRRALGTRMRVSRAAEGEGEDAEGERGEGDA